jgi:imidazolonepropionase-like amidohydrolase
MRATSLILAVLAAQASFAAQITPATQPGAYVFIGTFITPDQTLRGKMVVRGDTIECIGRSCAAPPGATTITVSDAYVFPGFIDAHQHMTSNIMPVWKNTKTYPQRYEWQRDPDHLAFMAPQGKIVASEEGACDALRYAEVRALISGVTTVQGTGRDRPCAHGLVRNADGAHELPLPGNRVVSYVPDVRLFNLEIDWNVTRSLAIHLGEGIDEYTRQELEILDQKGLLRSETMIIHGTAFGTPEFKRMARAGAKLVWSPQSNIALYGKSMNVEAAIKAGVDVSLGVDWSPSGSHDILAELKVADRVNRQEMHGIVKLNQWASMISSRPAHALSLDDYVGSLKAGKKADFVVLKRRSANPHESLLRNELRDVEMVWIGGTLFYGDRTIVEKLRPDTCETIEVDTLTKSLCLANAYGKDNPASETFSAIVARIRALLPGAAPRF